MRKNTDNAHGYHHRHYMGTVEACDFVSYEATVEGFQAEWSEISQLSTRLRRNRSAITKDVGMLEKLGLIVSNREANPGHGIQKVVRAVASKIELVATLG